MILGIIFIAKYLIYLVLLVAFIFFLKQNSKTKKEILIFALISWPLSYIVAKLGSWLYFNPRPFVLEHFIPLIHHAADNGFPSDHVLLASAVAMISYYYNRTLGLFLLVLAFLIGYARVILGLHHFLDIFASLFISILVSLIVYYLISGLKKKTKKKS